MTSLSQPSNQDDCSPDINIAAYCKAWEVEKKINNFRLPGFKKQIFDGLFIAHKTIKRIGKRRYNRIKVKTDLIRAISFDNSSLTAKIKLGNYVNTVSAYISEGIPIKHCSQIFDWYCTCNNPMPCLCTVLLFMHCIDRSPTSYDLCNDDPSNFTQVDGSIHINEVSFSNSALKVDESFKCEEMLNDYDKSVEYFSRSDAMVYLLLFYIGFLASTAPKCDCCSLGFNWNMHSLRWCHYCLIDKKSFIIHPFKSNEFLITEKGDLVWNIAMMKRFILFVISFPLDLPFTKQKQLIGVKDTKTMGSYCNNFLSICQLFLIVEPIKIDGPMAFDACYEGNEYKYHRGKLPPGHGVTWLGRAAGIQYTQKMGHLRRTKFSGVESYANYGEFLKSLPTQESQKLFLDGGCLTRSKLLNKYFNISWCVHKYGEFTKIAHLNRNRMNRSSVNLIEQSWRDDRLLRRLRKGCGSRNDPQGADNRQLWQDWLDWKHSKTDRTSTDIAITFFHCLSLLFRGQWKSS
eukprot:238473_1